MPVIVFASSKGGAGKTTACILLACELARQGIKSDIKISLLDADPNQHTAAWAKLNGRPNNIRLFDEVTEESILDTIEDAKTKSSFVLVDLEGVASNSVTYAISQADLVIIPCQASQNDAKEAVKTVKNIRNSARIIGREIPYVVLFGRVNAAIFTKNAKHLCAELESGGVELLKVSLIEREAFKSIFSFGGSISNLETRTSREKKAIEKAAINAMEFAEEVKLKLKSLIQK